MTSLFDECINGRFILQNTEPQEIHTFLNDGSHHYPSGLNRENGLGVITDADQMLPFSYDYKSANGIQLSDDQIQVNNPSLCFERGPFTRVEPEYPMETNMDGLNTLQTYPDGTLISPTALTVRQTDNQIIQTPAQQALSYQNQLLAEAMNQYRRHGAFRQLYKYQEQQERAEEQIIPTGKTGGPAPGPMYGEHQRRPEEIVQRPRSRSEPLSRMAREVSEESYADYIRQLKTMTKAKLVEEAKNRGYDIRGLKTKKDILSRVIEQVQIELQSLLES